MQHKHLQHLNHRQAVEGTRKKETYKGRKQTVGKKRIMDEVESANEMI